MFAIHDGPQIPFEVDSIISEATRQTGHSDFGDQRFLNGLNALVQSFKEGFAEMAPEKVRLMGQSLVALLAARLNVIADRKKYPEIAEEKIVSPLFFIGMARTGSTLIQSLFAQDPANISPEFWETMLPSPPPRFGMTDDRMNRVAQIMKWHLDAAPGFTDQHPYFIEEGFRALAECGSIMEMSFVSYQFDAFYPVNSYHEWFAKGDHEEAVHFHKMFLQHLQWGRPHRHWVLKAVEHGVWLEHLLKIYPDATFIWTHRDPYKQIGSLISNFVTVRQYAGGPPDDIQALGRHVLQTVRDVYARGMAARANAGSERFIDVYYDDLTRDQVAVVRGIYERIGRPFTAEAELRVRSWLRHNAPDKHAIHVYDTADYGLTRQEVEQALPEYYAAHGSRFPRSTD